MSYVLNGESYATKTVEMAEGTFVVTYCHEHDGSTTIVRIELDGVQVAPSACGPGLFAALHQTPLDAA